MWDVASAWPEKWCVGARPESEPRPPVAEGTHLTAKPWGWPQWFHFKHNLTNNIKETGFFFFKKKQFKCTDAQSNVLSFNYQVYADTISSLKYHTVHSSWLTGTWSLFGGNVWLMFYTRHLYLLDISWLTWDFFHSFNKHISSPSST